jgi:hypothetical protein
METIYLSNGPENTRRTVWMIKRCTYLALLILTAGVPAAASSIKPLSGRDLPILRNYFLHQYLQTITNMQTRALTRGDILMMNHRVSEWIDEYLLELDGRLKKLQKEYRAGEQFRDSALNEKSDAMKRMAARARWRLSLAIMEKEAGKIRGMLKPVLKGLKSKSNFEPEINTFSQDSPFHDEMRYLGEQIGKASRRIRDYFFSPTHIVNAESLQGENMMINLYHVQKMSESLRKEIERTDRERVSETVLSGL